MLQLEKLRSLGQIRLFPLQSEGDDPVALKTMSIDKLLKMKEEIEHTLAAKVSEQRRALEAELSKLGGYERRKKATGSRGGPVAAKYRNPENPSETWAGRGLKPRWLTAALKGGRKIEDYAIEAAGARGKARKKK
jgi:DNA-binding protein H-NS